MFLQDALKGFLADLDARGYSELTLLAYQRDVRVFLRYLKANDIPADLHVPTVACRRFPVYLRQRGESPTTIARRIHALRSFYSYLVKDERLDHSPFEDIQAPKRPETLPKYLEAEELERLLAATDHPQLFLSRRNRAIMAVLITTGIRRAEVLALDVEDVNLEQGFMRVNGKGKRQRVLPMPPETIDILKDYVNIRLLEGKQGPLFISRQGGRMNIASLAQLLKQAANKARLPAVSPHVLRHSYATLLLGRGIDIVTIQNLLGHRDVSTTQRYAHARPAALQAAMQSLRSLFQPTNGSNYAEKPISLHSRGMFPEPPGETMNHDAAHSPGRESDHE